MSSGSRAGSPRAPWKPLFGEDALRRLARLAGLNAGNGVVWLGEGGGKAAEFLQDISDCRASVLENLGEVAHGTLSLVVAPELAADEGLEEALRILRPALEVDGVAALVLRAFVGADVPEPLRKFWEQKQREPMRSVKATLARFAQSGFEPMTSELLAEPTLDEHDKQLLADASREIPGEVSAEAASGLRHGTTLGLFVGRRVEAGSPPRWPRRGGSD